MKLFKKKQTAHSLHSNIDLSSVGIFIHRQERIEQLKMIQLTVEDLRNIRSLKTTIEQNIEAVVEAFYSTIMAVPHLMNIIQKHSTTDRLRQTLRHHLIELFEGRIDDDYILKRMGVARVHLRIGLYPKWYIGAFQNLQTTIAEIIYQQQLSTEEERRLILSVNKILNFEQQIVLEEFDKSAERAVQERQEQVKTTVKTDIGEIASAIEKELTSATHTMTSLMHKTTELDTEVSGSIQRSHETKQTSQEGITQMEKLASTSETIASETSGMATKIADLNTASKQIREVVQMVKDIADQTNLLALNSAIEAARAGEHGKGFAVVAEEVRKLADQTKQSVDRIATLIEHSGSVTQDVVVAIDNVQKLVLAGQEESEKSMESFRHIMSSIDLSIEDIEKFSTHMTELHQVVKSVGEAAKEVMTTSQKLEHALAIL
ncbi:chemotaxis protein [Bacillaceae bacterium SAOS 7]|nr:chemotaxis protein [Bacillaceae bacterium SAOS 7]